MTKRALLIGINYPGSQCELNGCANDCLTSIRILRDHFGYPEDNIQFLTDANGLDSYRLPTRTNILDGIKWLVDGASAGDSLFFHYSGHGTWIRDTDGDEKDGHDECLCPSDYEEAGLVVDDELYRLLIEPLPVGCRLFSLMDCCHSGTMLDLLYSYMPERSVEKSMVLTGNKECPAHVVMISGCRDDQTSADAFLDGKYAGAMTTAFTKSLKNWFKIHKGYPKYTKLLSLMLKFMQTGGYSQRPQLNCSHSIDICGELSI